ncbi:protein arginine N-methyltransferase 3 [Aplysia californica]|uniref:type I protein arginine methyltransferase n=1 Tax=Aplysia californica TaxID=6500 RepID=A0ABM0K5M1_APLCA|nr:protein arginine N-methyltransferase 3 [Aplysia californica]
MATCGSDDDVPPLLSDDSECEVDDDDDGWDDVEDEEMNVLVGDVVCLFCSRVMGSVDLLLKHLREDHCFDLVAICWKYSVDSIDYIRLINYIRKQKPSPEDVAEGFKCGGVLWSSDEYMKTEDSSDLMLLFDIESAQTVDPQSPDMSDVSESEVIAALTQRLRKADEAQTILKTELERAVGDIERLRLSGQQFVMRMNTKDSAGDERDNSKSADHSNSHLQEEDGYFASYTHHDIHLTMLKDKVRTESYRDFMLCNPNLFAGRTVLDVGCGTGILSMFAVRAGASRVVAVDQSNIIYQAMDIARENNLHEKITFVKGKLEDVSLPVEKFDIIISEWMGYFLLFEAMLDSVLWARDRYLAPGGCAYPDHFSMMLVGVDDPEMRRAKLDFWDDVYGFKMSCMKSSVLDEVYVKQVKGSAIVTDPALIKDIDVMTCKVSELDFAADFSLRCVKDATVTAVVGYFITDFAAGCQKKISFSTGPEVTPTHWEQAVMLLPKPVPVTAGSCVDGRITYRKHPHDSRGILISLTVGKQTMKYNLS